KAWEKFQAALNAYYGPTPTVGNLEQLFTAGEEFYKFIPDQPFVAAHLALAGTNAVFGPIEYKNLCKVKDYVEKRMKVVGSAAPATENKPDQLSELRELIRAQGNQFLGRFLVETKGNQDDALDYLTKATQVKLKDGTGWKDPNNYLFRSGIYSKKCQDLKKQYDQLPDDQKNGDAGKALLKQINQLLDTKLIPEYARVLAITAKGDYKQVYDQTRPTFDALWKYRTGAPEKASEFLKAFEADPTVDGPEVPARAEDTAMTAPDNSNSRFRNQQS